MDLEINIGHLKDHRTESFKGAASTDFLETADLHFQPTLNLSGEAYLTEEHLVVKIKKADTAVRLPCSICNGSVDVPIVLRDFYHTEPLENIKNSFDVKEILREELLLAVPQFTECNDGHCPERTSLNSYLKSEKKPSTPGQFPFANL